MSTKSTETSLLGVFPTLVPYRAEICHPQELIAQMATSQVLPPWPQSSNYKGARCPREEATTKNPLVAK